MYPTIEAFWLSGQMPNTPVENTGVAASSLALSAGRALEAAPRTGTATTSLSVSGTRSLTLSATGSAYTNLDLSGTRALTASRSGSSYSNLDLSGSRTLLVAARTGTVYANLDLSGSRTLGLVYTGTATSDLNLAGTRALTATRTGAAYSNLDVTEVAVTTSPAVSTSTSSGVTVIRVSAYHRDIKSLTPGLAIIASSYSFPSSYTTGGVAFTLPLGVSPSSQATHVVNFNGSGGYTFEYVPATGVVKAYSGGGSEVAPGTDLSTLGLVNYVAHVMRGNNT